MSGGFFRGTSADQDTRFSNKQAKLMKSQKFAPELEILVDMTKVKMDVMRPWIAHRVTELLGFEDEVLINFIYGLLEEKVVNGKEIQISLTGFMEKNTGKFMKELWTHLLSAQKNTSGVPQQFLDAKEEETRKKEAETDRIKNEIQRKKEKEGLELEQEKLKKMAGEFDNLRASNAALEPSSRHQTRASSTWAADEKEANERNGSGGRNRISRSPHSAERSPSSPRGTRSRSISRSRSLSGSPQPVRRSISYERMHCSPSRRSITPHQRDSPPRSLSPPRRESSPFRRRSGSSSRHRSPSPVRRRLRSPMQRRSRSPIRRRWRSPMRRRSRSPLRRRTRSPVRRRSRSPMRRRSRSFIRRRSRSPMRYRSRSPVGRRSRSPLWRRSQSPMHPRSRSPGRSRSPSPMRRQYRRAPSTPRRRSQSPMKRRPSFRGWRRSLSSGTMSPSPQERTSESPVRRTPLLPVGRRSPKRQRRSPVQSPRDGLRIVENYSHVHRAPPKENAERSVKAGKFSGRPPVSVRSPQRDPEDRNGSRNKVSALSSSLHKSPSNSELPPPARKMSPVKERRSSSPYKSPVEQSSKRMIVVDIHSPPLKLRENKPMHPESVEAEEINYAREKEDKKFKYSGKRIMHMSTDDEHKDLVEKRCYKNEYSPERLASRRSGEARIHADNIEMKKDPKTKRENDVGRVPYPELSEQESLPAYGDVLSNERVRKLNSGEGYKPDERSHSRANDGRGSSRPRELENVTKLGGKVERNDRSGSVDSGSEESDEPRAEVNEKRKHKRSKRKDVELDDDYSNDSPIEERKEAKRRRKEEKRLRKEERRRRREERRHRKEDRRAEKLKLKSVGNVTPPSEPEKKRDVYASDGEHVTRRELHATDSEKAMSEQKRLEIELRKKALESLRAKKGISH